MSRETMGALLFGVGMIAAFGVTLGVLKKTPSDAAGGQPAGEFASHSLEPRMDDVMLPAPDRLGGAPNKRRPAGLPSLRAVARESQKYTVRPEDSLSKIARAFYGPGKGHLYKRILEANRETVPDAGTLREGQVLVIPLLSEQANAGAARATGLRPALPGRPYAARGSGG
jgi:nucleoid-associated protein YgaU